MLWTSRCWLPAGRAAACGGPSRPCGARSSGSISHARDPDVPQPQVMIVDDDPLVLTSLGKLRELETAYAVQVYSSAAAALEALRVAPPDVLVSDLTMPGMDGIDLLKRARELAPDAARIVLTGFADKDSAI